MGEREGGRVEKSEEEIVREGKILSKKGEGKKTVSVGE